MKREEIIRDLVERLSDAGRGQYIGIRCDVVREIVALLREQEAKPPIINENSYGWKFYYCPSCKKEFYQNHKFRFCEKCGQEVRWDD